MSKIALVGIGKIAVDQHVPAIAGAPEWELAATVSRRGTVEGVEAWTGIDEMLAARPDIGAVSLALPPVPRFAYAEAALRAGRHVMLEKPPGATLAECHVLAALAAKMGVTLFASWHSREAAMVAPAKAWLADRQVTGAHITWREDVRHWHPGQDWVFEPGGMGVLDPGINALSILTEILPAPVHLQSALLEVPANRQAPIAADLAFSGGVTAEFNWLQTGPQTWDIQVHCGDDRLTLREGGARMEINGHDHDEAVVGPTGEYPRLYERFARLVAAGESDVDLAPLVHVADAMMLGARKNVEAFEF
ncbi:D-galactose 1-dehydrogenase [Candidatus Rhodobacter oscarellae]|uniref:D-galactose 1-dehydrogenase n=1 Tax=Candidatus Rhodobacter oscarellae TaxID=1675527 RepID=A0A0J9E768_9RHOB|nr:Gfo/Idh/MocA family oxidoreductase [Candidatus Rhodobacter lobularis]KMW58562.1 D-galactose 1-dehydrogenase [Candidatus Rhodobacter lobularis]